LCRLGARNRRCAVEIGPAGLALAEEAVFAAIRNLMAELGSGHKRADAFDDNDYRLAFAALLVHAASIDADFSKAEREKLGALLARRFELDDGAADRLVERATLAEQEAVDLYRFTRLLNRTLDENQRLRMVEMLWEIAYADGTITEFEDNLIWRVADLIGVSSHERIALRERVATARGSGRA
jgi:uncharacterized tellurite resistance protein B-like protein